VIAVKSITQINDETLSEFKIMKDLNHGNIVPLYHYFQDKSKLSSLVFCILEICESDMQKYLENKIEEKIELDQIKAWCYQLLLGLEHLHSRQIIHRDLKPGEDMLFHFKLILQVTIKFFKNKLFYV
jgi:serine/threonine protein kinase